MILRLIVFFFLISVKSAFSQSELKISGKLVDSESQALSYASVQCINKAEKKLIKGELSDEEGNFIIEVPEGDYFLVIRYAGLKPDSIHLSATKGELSLGIITLKSLEELDNVEVIAQKNSFEYQLDKRIFNVGADINNQGANAVEVLENIPSITVDAEGNVSLRGNPNVRVLIDGKLSGFASNADALQQLRADNIERIEVITNASSRYDAQGEGGIINIILKKNQNNGLNVSASIRGGYYPELGGDIRINYRKNKINYFLNYSINRNQRPGISTTYQHLSNADTTFTYQQYYKHLRDKFSQNGALGFDFYLNESNFLTTSFGFRTGLGNNFYDRYYENMDAQDVITGFNDRDEYQKELEDMYEASVSYTKEFKKKTSWKTDVKWFKDQDIEKSDYNERSSLFNGERIEHSQVNTLENNLLFQSDVIIPFLTDGKVETGARVQLRNMDNLFKFGNLVNNEWDYPTIYNDKFKYNEHVYAAYLMASKTWKKISVQAGLRSEFSDITTVQASIDSKTNKKYIDFFPSAAVSFKTSEKQTFQISYSRRINRPGQWDLMPFTKFGDNKERRIGNPYITPEYTNSLEAGYLQNWKTITLLSSVYYRMTTDKIERISSLADDGIIYIKPMNVASKMAYGVELNATYTPLNWLRFNTGFNFFKEIIEGNYNNTDFRRQNFTWTNRTSVNFTFPKIIKVQMAFNYTAPTVVAQGKMLAIYFFDAAISRDLLKGSATIGFNVRDLFNTRRWRGITETAEIYTISNTLWRPRSFTLVFTYRFSQNKKEAAKTEYNLLDERGE
jgi:outer membrane receptor protein involved in Fe transport